MKWPWNAHAPQLPPSREELRPLAALFPTVDASDVQAGLDLVPLTTERLLDNGETVRPVELFSKEACLLTWRGLPLALPYRLYAQEPTTENVQALTSRQRQVLHCLYLRHHNGYVRQRHLEALLAPGIEVPKDFTIPFMFSLLGEYVEEIRVVLADNLTSALLAGYVALIQESPRYWQQTQGRVVSYWHVYYRRGRRGAPRFRHYVGARLLAHLHQALRAAGS